MERAAVMRWVAGYEAAWRDGDLEAVGDLFTADATYLRSPYEPPDVGIEAIRAFWLEDDDEVFTLAAEPVAVEGRTAVVRALVRYGDPVDREYTDLWVLRFADDGLTREAPPPVDPPHPRVERFEEWPFWPGKPFTASADAET